MTAEIVALPASAAHSFERHETRFAASYILPIKTNTTDNTENLPEYLRFLDQRVELIVVDGSPDDIFDKHHSEGAGIHLRPDPQLKTVNGKVWGVLTGIRCSNHERIII